MEPSNNIAKEQGEYFTAPGILYDFPLSMSEDVKHVEVLSADGALIWKSPACKVRDPDTIESHHQRCMDFARWMLSHLNP